jgi:ATP-dependent RNA circularization protein (DNA/RNA ligase family)
MNFVKFPRTLWLPVGHAPDKGERCISQADVATILDLAYCASLHISEKLDGANVGVGVDYKEGLLLQKRGGLIQDGDHPQYGRFKAWVYKNHDKFMRLPDGCTVFGEWLWAKHSIHYTELLSYFKVFDVYYNDKFIEPLQMEVIANLAGLRHVPTLSFGGVFPRLEKLVKDTIRPSRFSDEMMEGFVVRSLDGKLRAKYVRPDFISGDEHWRSKPVVENLLTLSVRLLQ